MLQRKLITDATELRALRSRWEELSSRSADEALPLHPIWLLGWWEIFGAEAGRSLRALAFFDGERLVGLAPLLLRWHVYRPGVPFRRLETLGSGEDPADETCGDYLGVLAERGREAEVADAFADALVGGKELGGWDELVLHSMSGDGVMPGLISDAFARRGLAAELEQWSTAPYVTLPRTWDEYLGALKPSRRALVRKSLRGFEAWAGGEPTLVRVRTAEELTEGARVLRSLHGERWASGGVFASRSFTAFHDRLMPRLLEAGALDLGWLEVRGEPVAAFYNFRWNGKLSFYQSGRRLDVPEDVRVGVAMHAYLLRGAIADGLREYDFLAGASQYKQTFALAERPLVRLRVARSSWLERARRAGERGLDQARRLRERARRELPSRTPRVLRPLLVKVLGEPPPPP